MIEDHPVYWIYPSQGDIMKTKHVFPPNTGKGGWGFEVELLARGDVIKEAPLSRLAHE